MLLIQLNSISFKPLFDFNFSMLTIIRTCLITAIFSVIGLNCPAQKNTKLFEMKGIDFKAGFSTFNLSTKDATKIYKDVVGPDLEKSNIHPISYIHGNYSKRSSSFYLGLSVKNKWFVNTKYIKDSENRLWLSYGINNNSPIVSDIRLQNDTISGFQENATIKYSKYSVAFDYLINSKPFLKTFAMYFGTGAGVMIHKYNAVNKTGEFLSNKTPVLVTNTNPTYVEIHNATKFTSVDLKLILGLKYNLSCDFNLFIETAIGAGFFQNGLYSKNKISNLNEFTVLGIRYKLVPPAEETHNNTFW